MNFDYLEKVITIDRHKSKGTSENDEIILHTCHSAKEAHTNAMISYARLHVCR